MEIPFSLAYGNEAMMLVEIGLSSYQAWNYNAKTKWIRPTTEPRSPRRKNIPSGHANRNLLEGDDWLLHQESQALELSRRRPQKFGWECYLLRSKRSQEHFFSTNTLLTHSLSHSRVFCLKKGGNVLRNEGGGVFIRDRRWG
jgi:hypothetical protein